MHSCLCERVARCQEPRLEEEEDDDECSDDDAAGGEWKCDDVGSTSDDGPTPSKTRRQTFDGPILPLDADSTFALPGTIMSSL